jgi:hypothetical protein
MLMFSLVDKMHLSSSRWPEDDYSKQRNYLQPDPDLDAIWRLCIGLDLENRSVLEAEVLISRICSAKSVPDSARRRALREEWESD